MARMRRAVASILVAAAVASVGGARADATETTALFHLDRGVAAFRAGDYLAARREFTIAHELVPDRANPSRWLALTAVQLGDCQAARASADDFLARVPAGDPRAAELERLRDLCLRTGALHVTTAPAGAVIHLDGAVVGPAPYHALAVTAGAHTVVADHPGRASVTRTVLVPAGGALAVELRLGRPARPLHRRWWFWPTVAGAAALTATAIVLASQPDDPAVLPPIRCDALGCRP